ncbi:MAG: L-aspartate oxidase [Gammaproteobacteria bacterium]|nr:L-aspartate oxidase [Gammaproteobacteria bacterium]
MQQFETDILIIGSGAAGLTLALSLADSARITVLSKADISSGCTLYAQGGIAAVASAPDSVESHVEDTLNAGAGLSHSDVAQFVSEQSQPAIGELVNYGVPFSRRIGEDGEGGYHLTKEGGHSHRRVYHTADATGRAIEMTLLEQCQAHENIELVAKAIAIDLITEQKLGRNTERKRDRVLGAFVLNKQSDSVVVYRARSVILASGGASKVYLYTSNPDISTGDGIAMAWRAGCRVGNLEFNQFHPTCLFHPKAKSFLITEALRGEGAVLRLPNGERFMDRFDKRAELAPRDIVARAIDYEMKRLGAECVYLDISHKPAEFIKQHFPTVYKRCLKYGFDITLEPIPVVPAAHYTCGGVMVDLNGESDIENLFAIGEVSFTGLHGANRLASNSLLECIVYGRSAAAAIKERLDQIPMPELLPQWDESRVTDSDEEVVVSHNWEELRHFMWDYVGIVRTDKRLQRAKRRIDLLSTEVDEYYSQFQISSDLIELRNLVQVADLIIQSAMHRKESRGLHFTLDYPEPTQDETAEDTILTPENYSG